MDNETPTTETLTDDAPVDEPLTTENARRAADGVLDRLPPYPDRYEGRGIVICGGGLTYFTCAWVCIRLLRRLGSALPVQLWYLGRRELDDRMEDLMRPLGVECVDATEVRRTHPARILNGWEVKPFAILHCPFREVLLLDADNLPVVNPEALFDSPQYRQTGAVFWPDFGRLDALRQIWGLCGVEYRDEPEFESGQLLVDKRRCWRALSLCMWYNEHSDFYYGHIHGDKETFHMAFRRTGTPYSMPARGVEYAGTHIRQHDFDGGLLFQHQMKWDFFTPNRGDGLVHEAECQGYLQELRRLWDGQIRPADAPTAPPSSGTAGGAVSQDQPPGVPQSQPPGEPPDLQELTGTTYLYDRVGYDRRPMTFRADGTVDVGADFCERYWKIADDADAPSLEISSDDGPTCLLRRGERGEWRGVWLHSERMPVVLSPVTAGVPEQGAAFIEQALPPSGRRGALVAALTRLYHLEVSGPVIVEIGSIRDSRIRARENDGWSTLCLAWYARHFAAEFHTVDRSEFSMRTCRGVTRSYADVIRYHVADACDFLAGFDRPISLLYWDPWEVGCENSGEFVEAFGSLAPPPRLVVIDDFCKGDEDPQYGRLLVSRALADGYRLLFVEDGQVCLISP